MSARIGGNVADIHDTSRVMADTGQTAAATGDQAGQVATTMQGQVEEVTTTLRSHFAEMARQLEGTIDGAMRRLAATDWEGASRAEAEAAAADLRGQTQRVLADALEWVEAFKGTVLSQAGQFVEGVQGQFRTIMGEVDATYASHSQAYARWADGLADLDQSLRRG